MYGLPIFVSKLRAPHALETKKHPKVCYGSTQGISGRTSQTTNNSRSATCWLTIALIKRTSTFRGDADTTKR